MSEDSKTERDDRHVIWTVVNRDALIAGHKEDGRTVYRREGKAKLVAAATVAGASVAKVVREHGLNANLLHVWIRQSRRPSAPKGRSSRRATKVVEGLERAAIARAANNLEATPAAAAVRLVPVEMTQSANPALSASNEALANQSTSVSPTHSPDCKRPMLIIEIGDARVVVEGEPVDGNALSTVIACLRDTQAR